MGGGIWAAIPGYLKARTGAHEVINTIMLNYVAFRLAELLVSGPLRDRAATAVQTPRISPAAELWTALGHPDSGWQDPLNALGVALVLAFIAWAIARALMGRRRAAGGRAGADLSPARRYRAGHCRRRDRGRLSSSACPR